MRQGADPKLQTERDAGGKYRWRMPLNRRPCGAEEQAHIKAQHGQDTTGVLTRFL